MLGWALDGQKKFIAHPILVEISNNPFVPALHWHLQGFTLSRSKHLHAIGFEVNMAVIAHSGDIREKVLIT